VVGPPDYLAQGVPVVLNKFSERVIDAVVLDFLLNFLYKFGDLGGECSGVGLGFAAEKIKDFAALFIAEGRKENNQFVNQFLAN